MQSFGFEGGDLPPRANLRDIMGQSFRITAVRDTPTKDHGYGANENAVTITTSEEYSVEGETYKNFLVTWDAVTKKLKSEKLREVLKEGTSIGPLKLVKEKSEKTGRDYYNIVDA